jgi:site-specific DNA-cytosine methylase
VNVLSLFDGISCGQLALNRAGIKYNNYYASEIDKFTKLITQKNFPNTFQLGDINNWKDWGIDLGSIDLIFAGFPCQSWSVAGCQKGDEDTRGALVHTLIDVWQAVKKKNPNVYFLFENVKMKKEFITYINNLFGIEGVLINSALVSAQNRKRLYWTNIPNVTQPEDKGIVLADIIAWSRSTRYPKNADSYVESRSRLDGKANTLTTGNGCGSFSSKNYMPDSSLSLNRRELTVEECETLQTLPIGFTEGISNSQRFKAVGNGWTVDVIAHILKSLK